MKKVGKICERRGKGKTAMTGKENMEREKITGKVKKSEYYFVRKKCIKENKKMGVL